MGKDAGTLIFPFKIKMCVYVHFCVYPFFIKNRKKTKAVVVTIKGRIKKLQLD